MDKHGPGDVSETGAVLIPVSIPKGCPWNAFTFSQKKISRAFFLVLFLFQKSPHQIELSSVHAGHLSSGITCHVISGPGQAKAYRGQFLLRLTFGDFNADCLENLAEPKSLNIQRPCFLEECLLIQ